AQLAVHAREALEAAEVGEARVVDDEIATEASDPGQGVEIRLARDDDVRDEAAPVRTAARRLQALERDRLRRELIDLRGSEVGGLIGQALGRSPRDVAFASIDPASEANNDEHERSRAGRELGGSAPHAVLRSPRATPRSCVWTPVSAFV